VIRPPSSLTRLAFILAAAFALAGTRAQAQIATNISGLYFTGQNSSGNLQAGGGQDANWTVTYASTDGGADPSTANEGAAYVITPSSVSGSGYTPNTANAQWITAPGAYLSGSTTSTQNAGGDYLPGNGSSGSNEGVYVYTLAFTITGSGAVGTVVSSQIQITMTLAADDQYSVFVNPAGNGTTNPTGTAAASQTSAWTNKSQITLQNYGGGANNSKFVIGTNYIVVVVDNTNSISGASTATGLNASGLLVFQTSAATINGQPVVPEVAAWLPVLGVVGCYGFFFLRRRQGELRPVRA
jgi:hypothetical protein